MKFIEVGATCDTNLHADKIWQFGHGLFDKEGYICTMMLPLEILEILDLI